MRDTRRVVGFSSNTTSHFLIEGKEMEDLEEYGKRLDAAEAFARKNIAELARLIMDWKKSGLLNNGKPCLVHHLASMLPDRDDIRFTELIINDICLEIVANRKGAKSIQDEPFFSPDGLTVRELK